MARNLLAPSTSFRRFPKCDKYALSRASTASSEKVCSVQLLRAKNLFKERWYRTAVMTVALAPMESQFCHLLIIANDSVYYFRNAIKVYTINIRTFFTMRNVEARSAKYHQGAVYVRVLSCWRTPVVV